MTPEIKALHEYRRACEVLIEVKLSDIENPSLPVATVSPMVTPLRKAAPASVTSTGSAPSISTSHVSVGMMTSLSGPVTWQVMAKLSPAVGIPCIDI